MTTPNLPAIDLSSLVPSKAKAWVALAGGALTLILPFLLEYGTSLPQPWPIVIGVLPWLLTAFGVRQTKYLKPGASIAVETTGMVATADPSKPDDVTVVKTHLPSPQATANPVLDLGDYDNPFPPV